MGRRLRLAVVCGGKSGEHEVSLRSARSIIEAADKKKYELVVMGVDKEGVMRLYGPEDYLLHPHDPAKCRLSKGKAGLAFAPSGGKGGFFQFSGGNPSLFKEEKVDVVFPLIHGPYGEDGCLQGLLEMANLPYVGSDVLSSSITMDKEVTKRLVQAGGIPVAPWVSFNDVEWKRERKSVLRRCAGLGFPCFVKPANLGSSVGVSRVVGESRLAGAIKHALEFDTKVIAEKAIDAREIEVALLGNEEPIASLPGEVVVKEGFYSYEAKYLDPSKTEIQAPARLTDRQTRRVRELAIKAFKILCCRGMVRADFFLQRKDGRFILNELNSIPGFTAISLYPRLWELSGISRSDLLDRLVELALERFQKKRRLRTSVF